MLFYWSSSLRLDGLSKINDRLGRLGLIGSDGNSGNSARGDHGEVAINNQRILRSLHVAQ